MGPGDVPKYPKEVSTKKMTLKKLNLKKWFQISENPPLLFLGAPMIDPATGQQLVAAPMMAHAHGQVFQVILILTFDWSGKGSKKKKWEISH